VRAQVYIRGFREFLNMAFLVIWSLVLLVDDGFVPRMGVDFVDDYIEPTINF
jgi:hypothetical protein